MYSPLVRHQRILLVVGVLGLVLSATPFTVASTAAKSGGGPMPPVAPNLPTFPSELRFVHPPALGAGGHASAPHPSYGYVYYTQEGATLAQFNGSSSQSGVKSISEDIPLVNSPYPIGYELNGLTSTGDWYQIVIGVNWPGCSGYEMITEVWNNAQYGGPVGCSTAVTMTPGDLIRLGLNFSAKAGICMDLTDVTRSSGAILCQAQPDAGATEFITLQSTSDTNGYFTGPMTEIANTSAGSCPDYTHMPLVNYEYPKSFGLDEYVAWSDEFELTTGSPCYGSSGGLIGFSSGDPATDYDDTAIGTSYGPHYVAGQLYSLVTPSYGFRIQTDPVPLTSLTLSASATTIPVSTNVTLTASLGGGVKPYTAIWSLNGTIFANGSLQRNFTGAVPGSYRFNAYGVDKLLDVIGPSSTVTVLVNGPLAVSSITTSLATGNADVGQSITFRVAASGGLPPYSYAWFGLPAECPGSNVPTVACTPTSPGTYPIHVTVTDANHTVLDSGTRAFVVSPALAPTLQASVTQLDIGQSTALVLTVVGGSGNLTYGWAGLPPPCAAANRASIDCAPSAQGLYTVTATVSDTN
ncbi:MAG: PKD domain-containing protein, partial [Thermoplasmata archaeon]|nr:PKD domain-containing protein [Thermoplasmata archaeon]